MEKAEGRVVHQDQPCHSSLLFMDNQQQQQQQQQMDHCYISSQQEGQQQQQHPRRRRKRQQRQRRQQQQQCQQGSGNGVWSSSPPAMLSSFFCPWVVVEVVVALVSFVLGFRSTQQSHSSMTIRYWSPAALQITSTDKSLPSNTMLYCTSDVTCTKDNNSNHHKNNHHKNNLRNRPSSITSHFFSSSFFVTGDDAPSDAMVDMASSFPRSIHSWWQQMAPLLSSNLNSDDGTTSSSSSFDWSSILFLHTKPKTIIKPSSPTSATITTTTTTTTTPVNNETTSNMPLWSIQPLFSLEESEQQQPELCDTVHTVFLNSQDNRTCLALVPQHDSLSSISNNKTSSFSLYYDQNPSSSWTSNMLVALTRRRRNQRQQHRRKPHPQDNGGGGGGLPQKEEEEEHFSFIPTPWYDDHNHKPPWRLSSAPKPILIHQLWWPNLHHYLTVFPTIQQALLDFLQHQVDHRRRQHIQETKNNNASSRTQQLSWIVLVTNVHHVELLANWKCAAQELDMDFSHVLVVALDMESYHVATHDLALITFYHESLVPLDHQHSTKNNNNDDDQNDNYLKNKKKKNADYASRAYGMVMLVAKVHVVHLLLSTASLLLPHDDDGNDGSGGKSNNPQNLNLNFLFHDVDIVPLRRDYLEAMVEYLVIPPNKKKNDDGDDHHHHYRAPVHPQDMDNDQNNQVFYDMVFQYDFASSSLPSQTPPEYAPWFLNSGFYLVRHSPQTVHWANELVRYGDWILRSNSHQAVVSYLVSRLVANQSILVRILHKEDNNNNNEADLFPGGYHFHHRWEYMHNLIAGKLQPQPYIFHMNYNDNKETKRQFLEQMGWWFLLAEEEEEEEEELQQKVEDEKKTMALGGGGVPPPVTTTSSRGHGRMVCRRHTTTTNNNNSNDPHQDATQEHCHFRDKPSRWPSCQTFPVIESGQSFW